MERLRPKSLLLTRNFFMSSEVVVHILIEISDAIYLRSGFGETLYLWPDESREVPQSNSLL